MVTHLRSLAVIGATTLCLCASVAPDATAAPDAPEGSMARAVRAYDRGQWVQGAGEPGEPAVSFRTKGTLLVDFMLLSPAICTSKSTGQMSLNTMTIAGAGAPQISMPAHGRVHDTAPVADLAPGSMDYRIRLKDRKGVARFHIVMEDDIQRCQSDPTFLRLRLVSHR